MASGILLLALVVILGSAIVLAPIVAEYHYACRKLQQPDRAEAIATIAPGYRYVCWATGTAMIAAAIVLLFRLEW
ncbi:MAG: hypothetical protein HC936_11965 [Leptolyngbyaceae cyanobacterium SU_3_3]|nr:hypothetical protein [Leptolyngbyaceae cyanobacterium SU_3_3]NJR50168.1 hypothetical protein [Leptolyngbyaceae cyanobacterium CSU_1_3]